MIRYMSAAVFAAGALSIAGSAQAQCAACELFPPINNNQTFSGALINNKVNLQLDSVAGDVKVTGTAVGNNLSIDAGKGTTGQINNVQTFASNGTNVTSTVNVGSVTHGGGKFGGKLDVDNTAVANNASIKLGACCTTAPVFNNTQTVRNDPTAITNVALNSVASDVDINTTAVGNNASVEGRLAQINNVQTSSRAPVNSITNVSIGSVGGTLSVVGTAVGNNMSWKLGS